MKSNPEISFITVNYNGFQDTKELIDSLHAHFSACSHEIIVVDNGSLQDEAQLLQNLYPHIRTLRSEHNLGFAGGNNLGIEAAQGKYLLFINNDTYITDDSLIFLKERLETTPECAAASPKIKFAFTPQNIQFAGFTPLSKYTLRNSAIGYNEADQGQYNQPSITPYLHGAAMIVRQDVIKKIGKMPENYFLYYEELDWCTRMTKAGYTLWYEPRSTVFHKESRSTGKSSPMKIFYLTRNRLLYTWRHRRGLALWGALMYQLFVATPKNTMTFLIKGELGRAKAVIKGCYAFFKLEHKSID